MAENRMTSGTAWKQILYFSLPVFVGLLLQQLYNTVDTIVVGNFASEAELSAVGTTGSLTFLFLAVANAITPKMFREELEADEGDITVWINSPGGSVFAAAEIYTMLCEYSNNKRGKVTVKIDAIAAVLT